MKKIGTIILVLISLTGFQSCSNSSDPSAWNEEKIDKWFESGAFLNGWNVTPDQSINKREFAIAYFKNRARWDKAFEFLKTTDLKNLEVKRHDIDGDNIYAIVSEYLTKNEEDAKFEAHKKYIDIQYVISGAEQMSITPVSKKGEVLTPYDETKDLEFMTVSESKSYTATPEKFFLFFPSDLHRPSVKVGENAQVKKVVVKVKI
jgi:YhcH/YjgK/YiaL family protein